MLTNEHTDIGMDDLAIGMDEYTIEPGESDVIEVYDVVHPKQRLFMNSTAKYRLFGGAAGGGKSHAMRMEVVKQCLSAPGVRGIVLRRTFPEIEENMINPLLQELHPSMYEYNATKHILTFYNGSTIRFGYCRSKKDILQYHGLQYDFVCIEELTHWTESEFKMLRRVLRSARAGIKPNFFASTNPGGIGHSWVKRLWIDRQFKRNQDGTYLEDPEDYEFIPSRVYDNPSIMEADLDRTGKPEYIKILEDLPEKQRKALLLGDWNVFEGQYFNEWNENIHVIDPTIPIDGIKRRIVCVDYGSSKPCAVYWLALTNQDRIIVYREVYKPMRYEELAQCILDNTTPEEMKDLKNVVVDPSICGKKNEETGSTGKEILEKVFRRNGTRLKVRAGNNRRMDGWNAMHKWLQPIPMPENPDILTAAMVIAANCDNAIRTIPDLVHDEKDVEDLDTTQEDHPADSLRYGVMFLNIRPPQSLTQVQNMNTAMLKTQQKRDDDRSVRKRRDEDNVSILTKVF